MQNQIELHAHFPVKPETFFQIWLDSARHSAMTGGEAKMSDQVGAAFSTWDGYITGVNLELEKPSRIVQSWRTTKFSIIDPDARLELLLQPAADGTTNLSLRLSSLPKNTAIDYQQGWLEFYFTPMQEYFTLHPDQT